MKDRIAHTQYNDWAGTAAGDFPLIAKGVTIEHWLGLADGEWLIVGVSMSVFEGAEHLAAFAMRNTSHADLERMIRAGETIHLHELVSERVPSRSEQLGPFEDSLSGFVAQTFKQLEIVLWLDIFDRYQPHYEITERWHIGPNGEMFDA